VRLARAIVLRLLYGILSLIFISLVTFVADEIAPGDAVTAIVSEKADAETKARIRKNLGLDRPAPERYARFLGNIARGDFGRSYSYTQERVSDMIARALPMTAMVGGLAMLLAGIVGVGLGTLAAINENRFADRAVLSISTLGVTVPNFVLAPILVLIFYVWLDTLPAAWSQTRVVPDYMYLILPVSILALRPMALLTRLTRASMVETLKQEFIRTAIAKGVPPGRLFFRHALRNAILPVITAFGTSFGFLLTGSFVIERAFALPGLGSMTIEAISRGDFPVVAACVLLTGAIFIVINLIVDLILPFLDPRIRESVV
jgi:ABC-type dipeptide/oligopeptide/nickel transport system permease component